MVLVGKEAKLGGLICACAILLMRLANFSS